MALIGDYEESQYDNEDYFVNDDPDYSQDVTDNIVSLYPTGQWWNLNINSIIYKVHNAIGVYMARAWDGIKKIGNWILEIFGYWDLVIGN